MQSILIHCVINGLATEMSVCTVTELLAARGWTGKRLAVERNGQIVPRSQHASTRIEEGDVLEIVIAVGGG